MSNNQKTKRTAFLKRLFGDDAKQIEDGFEHGKLEEVAKLLDKLRIAKKNVSMGHKGVNHTQYKAMIEEAVAGIESILSTLTESVPEGLAQQILAIAISALADEVVEDPTNELQDDEVTEPLTEDEEDEDEEMIAMANVGKNVSDLLSTVAELTGILTSVKATQVKLAERVSKLERMVAGRPKRASQAKETEVAEDDELAEKIKEQLVEQDKRMQELAKVVGLTLGGNR